MSEPEAQYREAEAAEEAIREAVSDILQTCTENLEAGRPIELSLSPAEMKMTIGRLKAGLARKTISEENT
jgi:hypothetical protein